MCRGGPVSTALDSEKLCILHVLYAQPAIFACLSMLFSAMMHHSYVPSKIGLSIVLPTLKNEAKSTNDVKIIGLSVSCQ